MTDLKNAILLPCKKKRIVLTYDEGANQTLTIRAEHDGSEPYTLEWVSNEAVTISKEVLQQIESDDFGFLIPQKATGNTAEFPFKKEGETTAFLEVKTPNSCIHIQIEGKLKRI